MPYELERLHDLSAEQQSGLVFVASRRSNEGQQLAGNGLLMLENLPEIVPQLFRGSDTLERTMTAFGVTPEHLQNVMVTPLSFGLKAIIMQCEALVDDGRMIPFIVYLSKGARGVAEDPAKGLGEEAEADYDNLQTLAADYTRAFDIQRMQQDGFTFNVVSPIALGQYTDVQGNGYPFFTMPFIPYGEVGLRIGHSGILKAPFFTYAVAHNDMMKHVQDAERDRANAELERIEALESIDYVQPLTEAFTHQRESILRALLCMYFASDNRLPSLFQVNSGDFIGEINDESIQPLFLITVRGGYTEHMTKEDLRSFLQNHRMLVMDEHGMMQDYPLFGENEKDFNTLFNEQWKFISKYRLPKRRKP